MFDPLLYIYMTKRTQSESVIYSSTEPEDKTVIWFDTNIRAPKVYDINEKKWRLIGTVIYSPTEPSDKTVIWFDTNMGIPKIYDVNENKWRFIGNVVYSTTEPSDKSVVWFDTSTSKVKIYDINKKKWKSISESVVYSSTKPDDETVIWFDTNARKPKIYDVNKKEWEPISESVIYSSSAPSDKSVIWFDTSIGKPKIYDSRKRTWRILAYATETSTSTSSTSTSTSTSTTTSTSSSTSSTSTSTHTSTSSSTTSTSTSTSTTRIDTSPLPTSIHYPTVEPATQVPTSTSSHTSTSSTTTTTTTGYTHFDHNSGGAWPEYINIRLLSTVPLGPDAPVGLIPMSEIHGSVQYKIEINKDKINVYSNDGTKILVSGTGGYAFWNKVRVDGADIRVFDETRNQIYFWVEKFDYANQHAIIWVKLYTGQDEVNIAYGNHNCSVSSYNDGNVTFEFFDDFNDGVIDTKKWVKVGNGTVKEENGYLEIIGPGYAGTNMVHLFTTKSFSAPCIVETRVMIVSHYANLFFFAQSQKYQTSNNTFNHQIIPSIFRFAVVKDGHWSLARTASIGKTIYTNTWYRWQIILKSDKHIMRLDDCAPVSWTPTQKWTSGYMALKAWEYDHCKHDWFFIRRYLESDISFGTPTIKKF